MKARYSVILLAGLLVSANTAQAAMPSRSGDRAATPNFCTRFTQNPNKFRGAITEREGKLAEERNEHAAKVTTKAAERTDKLGDIRSEADTKRMEQYNLLLDKAETDAQKAAVEKFKTTIAAAITVRRSAVDAAIANFRTNLDAAVTAHKAEVDAAIAKFKAATDAATTKAKDDCASGVDPKTAMQTFMTSMRAAQAQLKTDRAMKTNLRSKVEELQRTRKAAIDKAFADFKTSSQAARAELKAAFGK